METVNIVDATLLGRVHNPHTEAVVATFFELQTEIGDIYGFYGNEERFGVSRETFIVPYEPLTFVASTVLEYADEAIGRMELAAEFYGALGASILPQVDGEMLVTLPSMQVLNTVLAERFNRPPEQGFPLITEERAMCEDGYIPSERIMELAAEGSFGITYHTGHANGDDLGIPMRGRDYEMWGHDILAHLPGYIAFSSANMEMLGVAAQQALELGHIDNYDYLADILDRTSSMGKSAVAGTKPPKDNFAEAIVAISNGFTDLEPTSDFTPVFPDSYGEEYLASVVDLRARAAEAGSLLDAEQIASHARDLAA